MAEPSTPTGQGPTGAHADPPVSESRSADPGRERGAHGGRDAQGGPRSPRLANLRLDEFDKELEQRGHRFARDADEATIDVRSRQAGERVMARVTRFREHQLRLTVNAAKSAVDRPWNRTFLGFTCTRRRANRRRVSDKALKAFNAKVRALTSRTRGRTMRQIVTELRQLRLGWRACFGFAEGRSPRRDLDPWIRRRRRRDHWKPWGRKRYSGAADARRGPAVGLEHGQVGPWPVASASEPRAGDGAAAALLRGAGAAQPG